VVDAIECQYADTYRRLAGKSVSDGSPTSARHGADTFEPAPNSASTLRASLNAQAAALTSIRATVTDVLASDSTQYPRWRDQVLQTLRRYALADHVLSAVPDPSEDWLLMDEVVLSWIHGTLTAELQDIVRVLDDTAHRIWGALEAQFLGHRQTRILYLETAFRQLAQGDLSVDEYCRQMKTMADTLLTLGAPITDECLELNLLRGLSPRFDRVTPILTRMNPFQPLRRPRTICFSRSFASPLLPSPLPPRCSSGCPLCLREGFLFSALWSPAAWSSSAASWLRGGGSRPWSQEWTQWHAGRPRQLPVALFLQSVDWHHSHVAQAVRGCLGPSPRHPSADLLCRSSSGSALGTSSASAGAPPPSGTSGPARVGALD
jgi:hypothetical protein